MTRKYLTEVETGVPVSGITLVGTWVLGLVLASPLVPGLPYTLCLTGWEAGVRGAWPAHIFPVSKGSSALTAAHQTIVSKHINIGSLFLISPDS